MKKIVELMDLSFMNSHGYFEKSIDIQNKLGSYLNLAIQKVKKDVSTIKFQINGEIVEIPLEWILYIESDLHTVNVYAIRDVERKSIHFMVQ